MLPFISMSAGRKEWTERASLITYLDSIEAPLGPAVVCLGFFDGVHKGHMSLMSHGKKAAKQLGFPLFVHTYDIPPASVIKRNSEAFELTPLGEKARLLLAAGADRVVVSKFDDQLMHTSGKDFFYNVLVKLIDAKHIIIGFDHRFGYRGDMGPEELSALCKAEKIGINVVPAVKTTSGELISSSAIRDALRLGYMALAEEMLGRPVDNELLQRMQATAHHVQNSTTDGGHRA